MPAGGGSRLYYIPFDTPRSLFAFRGYTVTPGKEKIGITNTFSFLLRVGGWTALYRSTLPSYVAGMSVFFFFACAAVGPETVVNESRASYSWWWCWGCCFGGIVVTTGSLLTVLLLIIATA